MDFRNLLNQYDEVSGQYSNARSLMNEKSDSVFWGLLNQVISRESAILDLGCGPGHDLQILKNNGCNVFGIDSSEEMVKKAQKNLGNNIIHGRFDASMPFQKNQFDVVISKWALQTARDIQPIYNEVVRILKPGGYFIFLAVHPLRQFMEQRRNRNYFDKKIVNSRIFDKTITVQEPCHTLSDWLSPHFLKHFVILSFKEGVEYPAAEQIGNNIYPTFFAISAVLK